MALRSWTTRIAALAAALALGAVTTGVGSPAVAATTDQPEAVSVPGSFGAQVGCDGDWQPDCDQVQLTRRSSDDVWATTVTLAAGTYEYKAALNRSWDVNYGRGGVEGGANVELTVPADGTAVTFYYDNATHWVTTDADAALATAAGSFQSELGCPADWSPDCLRSWLEDPDGDGVATFTTAALPAGKYQVKVAVGLSWDVNYGAGGVPGGANIDFTVPTDGARTTFRYVASTHVLTVLSGNGLPDLSELRGYWLSRGVVGWAADGADSATTYRLYAASSGGLTPTPTGITGGTSYPLTRDTAGLPGDVRARFPAQAGLPALRLPADAAARAAGLLTGQVVVAAFDAHGRLLDATGLQVPGVLDDIDAGAAAQTLGLSRAGAGWRLALWAPTAQQVSLQVYRGGAGGSPVATVGLRRGADGVWSATGNPNWKGLFYLFRVRVFVPETGRVETNLVTDPYSLGLSEDSRRSLFVDLDDPALAPAGWATLGRRKPTVAEPAAQAVTELHVRDFSAADTTVPAAHRGTYLAFTDARSDGTRDLRALAAAGTTTVHLLPVNDIATRTIDENRSTWQTPACQLRRLAPDSERQQECVAAVADRDGYNWGYDPQHFTVPEGSYATEPDGPARTLQFRQMVSALNGDGLRVVQDVVYNHTADSGQTGTNDLDRIVPGYYHRLDATGHVTTSTCCADTATEHTMMGKLLIDSVTTWATRYKVDGFRFDLMGFIPKSVMVSLRHRLDGLTVARDGVDGRAVYLYGEGWNFGDVADDALFVQATQANMAGTGIGTFNDRIRDAVRGGSFDDTDPRTQGWASGLFTDPNGDPVNGAAAEQRARLLLEQDQIKVGLVGNLADYTFTDRTGAVVTGSEVDYNGAPTGYTAQPQEAVNYVDAHDDQTLYDLLTYKLPVATSMADRIRMQNLAMSTVALSQGVSFWQAGTEALRSKSFDSNSYDSGDWFNALDPSLHDNGFGHGLPPAADNQSDWPYARPLLADPALNPSHTDLLTAADRTLTLLRLRAGNPLLHLGSAGLIQQKVTFPDSGPSTTPGVIVERVDDTAGPDADPARKGIVIVFNAGTTTTTQTVPATIGQPYRLEAAQAHGSDPVVRRSTHDEATGAFTVPARSFAVFELR